MKKFLSVLGLLFLGTALAQAGPTPDPRVEKIKAQLALADLFGLQAPTGISQQSMIDFAGVGTGLSGCPPAGKARAFYDVSANLFKVIDSSCALIIGGTSGGVQWNQLLNPNGNLSPNFGGSIFNFCCGVWDWGTMDMRIPHGSSVVPSSEGQIGYDPVGKNLYFFSDVSDIVGRFSAAGPFTDGDLAAISVSGGTSIKLTDKPLNQPSGNTIWQVTTTNVQLNDVPCVTDLGPPLTVENCTAGIPVNLQIGTTYTYDGVNDRGTAIVSSNVGAQTYTLPLLSAANDTAGNFFTFQFNKNTGTVTINATAPNTFDSTGSGSETLKPGENVSLITDDSTGIIYPKFSPGRLTAGIGVTITPTAGGYGQTIAAAGASKLRCETGLGDGLNAMAAGTYLQFFCVNTSGGTWTITGINCWTDNNGSSTLQAANNAATNLLTGAVTCTNTKSGGGAAGTQSGTTTLPNNDAISFTFVADGTSKQTTWTVSMTQ